MPNKETNAPWLKLDSRINDLGYLAKTFGALCDHILDRDEELGTILMSPIDELIHIQNDIRRAFDAYHEQTEKQTL